MCNFFKSSFKVSEAWVTVRNVARVITSEGSILLQAISVQEAQMLCEDTRCVDDVIEGTKSQGVALWTTFKSNLPLSRWDGLNWGS